MKKILFALMIVAAFGMKAQTTLDQRVTLVKDGDFNLKLKIAMQQVAIGILTTPTPADADSAATLALKKDFARGIILNGGDIYLAPIIASGQVNDASADLVILGVISQMFDSFINYKQGQ